MSDGFILVDIAEIRDPERYLRYRENVGPSFDAAGGEYLVRGGEPESLEGEWRPSRIVVARFPSFSTITNWWSSSEYQGIKQDRTEATESRFLAFTANSGAKNDLERCGAFLLVTSTDVAWNAASWVSSLCGFACAGDARFAIQSNQITALEGTWKPAAVGLAGYQDRPSAARCMIDFRRDVPCEERSSPDANSVVLLSRFQKQNS